MDINIVNITPIFWEIISNIVHMEYDQLSDTESFKDLCNYEKDDKPTYILYLDDINLATYPQDLNDIFYGTLRFYKAYSPHSQRYLLLKKAIERIEKYITIEEDITDLLDSPFFK